MNSENLQFSNEEKIKYFHGKLTELKESVELGYIKPEEAILKMIILINKLNRVLSKESPPKEG